ncbi:MAG: CBS domain-containing protein [Ignavibacteria bacterium]|nr:CBS domain-containing protein [Ignavibacteria bacterium]
MKYTALYFSRILHTKVFSHDFQVMGKLLDLIVTMDMENPMVIAASVRTPDGTKTLDWRHFVIEKQEDHIHISCKKIVEIDTTDKVPLKKRILDKQIIDLNGRKVVRVNDIRLAIVPAGTFVIAVDIGAEGLLRRLGVSRVVKKLGITAPAKVILWKDVETVLQTNDNLVLAQSYDKLMTLHPSDLAEIIEDVDQNTGMLIFSKLSNEKSADVLEEMEEDTQVKFIESLPAEKAADILEEMPSDEAADILDNLDESKAEELLSNMEKELSDEIRDLMEYEENEIGSIMNNEFVSFPSDATAEMVIAQLRHSKPEEGLMNYIYTTNAKGKLVGKVSLRDLVLASGTETLKSLMNKEILFLYDKDDIDNLIEVVSKYNLLSIPIVNQEQHLVGSVLIHDILDEVLKK